MGHQKLRASDTPARVNVLAMPTLAFLAALPICAPAVLTAAALAKAVPASCHASGSSRLTRVV
jgi:hypothetical protein